MTTQDTIDTATFGRYLRSLRLYGRGIARARTQRQVAALAGLSFVDLSKMESDRLPPPDDATLVRLMTVLDGDVAMARQLVQDWKPASPLPDDSIAIECGPHGCRVRRVGC